MDPNRIARLVEQLHSDRARLKVGAGRKLRLIAERRPELLAPHFDAFVRLLDHPGKLFQWEAIFVLSHLARVDEEGRFDAIFTRYFEPIRGPVMITAANVILAGARIAAAKPRWADRIAREILGVARARYQTGECRRIAIGHAITAFDSIYPMLSDPGAALRFVRRQLRCARPATRKKAARFLGRHDPINARRRTGRGPGSRGDSRGRPAR
ncbi:MAG TPA: hypothetical protein VJU16_02895 [Planctomycetota bacterium]|nr:hypothetical protein [Planctomycetota bacterium]